MKLRKNTEKVRIYPKSKEFLDNAESLKNYKTYPQKIDVVIKLSAPYFDEWLKQPINKKRKKWDL